MYKFKTTVFIAAISLFLFNSPGFCLESKKNLLPKDSAAETKESSETLSNPDLNSEKPTPSAEPTPQVENSSLAEEVSAEPEVVLVDEYVRRAWEASGKNNLEKVKEITGACEEQYGEKAKEEQGQLSGFPTPGKENDFKTLNDVATCLFIRAEALMNNGKTEEAMVLFQKIIDEYKWAKSWDPRGWFWSVAEKSQASIDTMTGKREREEEDLKKRERGKRTNINIAFKGKEDVIDYLKYGQYTNVGTKDYKYVVNDPKGLSEAVGEGIYPNTGSILKDPGYKKAMKEGRLEGSHWDFVRSQDFEAAFYKWATAPEPWGIKLFYLGIIFEKANMPLEAMKAYHALIVHFPNAVGWTYWQTPWYPGQAAVAKLKHLARKYPELELKFEDAKVQVLNGFDNDVSNDTILTNPGRLHTIGFIDRAKEKLNLDKPKIQKLEEIKKMVGTGTVRLVKYNNNHWQLMVNNEPYLIRGVTYAPTKIGQSPDKGTLTSWMVEDVNENKKLDGPYDAWVDENENNVQDENEPVVGDFQLLKDMGVNTIREYHQPFTPQKEVLRKMYEEYGFHVIMGDFLGKYTLGSKATWAEGTDYDNPEHQKNMMDSVREMVMEYKDEPYILIWLLGNENNYGVASNADKKPESYFKFVNEVAKMIKSIDPNHPVAICNGDTLYLDIFAKNAPDVDIYSANVYRGDYGFGSFWEQVQDAAGKPAFITEYGCPAYADHLSLEEGEEAQADYHRGNWVDIEENSAGYVNGAGNAIGGVAFEWLDEWWKNYEPFYHDRKSDAIGPFPGGYYFEEWFGLVAQGNGKNSPYMRQLRKVYFTYQELWNASKK